MTQQDLRLRRRLVVQALDLRPADVRRAMGNPHPVRVTSVLNGAGRLRPAEARGVVRLFNRQTRRLFAGSDE